MSNINDALKRTQQAQTKTSTMPDSKMPGMPPVNSRPDRATSWILPVMVSFLLVAAGLFIGLALLTHTSNKMVVQARPRTTPTAKSGVASAPGPKPAAAAQATTPASIAAPALKLQGIVYATTRPWAIVDGQTLHVGDPLGEYRVQAIAPDSVTLEKADGSREKLSLDK